ncbi:MAG TPA: M48 family metalloprotease [Solirubrobacteraceae bacterium]|nr:M48 family metalloprotease [Solirubrobacteraceae bacterium]
MVATGPATGRPRRRRPPAWAGALIAALAVAELAVIVLRPRTGVISPLPVDVHSVFSSAQITRAQDFRRPQLLIYAGSLLIEGALLVALVRRPPRRLRGPFRRPLAASALAAGGLSLALTAATLPLAAISRQRALDVGLATQSWGGWTMDVAKGAGLGALMAAGGGAAAIALMRRLPRLWWVPASGVAVVVGAVFLFAGPVVLDPLFNHFTPVPAGALRSDVIELAQRAGVKVGQVYEVDASRRTTAANAYVTGLGATKRVVLYDTLIKGFTREETRTVVAHELGHVHYSDVPRGLIYLALVAPLSLLSAALLTSRLAPGPRFGSHPRVAGPDWLPALALSLGLVVTSITMISNGLSRSIEARADSFALRLTGEPAAFESFERRITLLNLADPQPPGWVSGLLGTHPSTVRRIGIARAYEAGAR